MLLGMAHSESDMLLVDCNVSSDEYEFLGYLFPYAKPGDVY